MTWLRPIIDGVPATRPTLVVCRTDASVLMVKRALLAVGASVGVEVATPVDLAQRFVDVVVSDRHPNVPASHPWAAALERPGLRRHLEDHLCLIRLELGRSHEPPTHVQALLDAGWGECSSERRLLGLLALAQGGELPFASVFAVGFGSALGDLGQPPGPRRTYARILQALDATPLSAPPTTAEPPSVSMSQVDGAGDEARWVSRTISAFAAGGGELHRVLVLVTDYPTAIAIQAELAAEHITANLDVPQPLGAHPLAPLLRLVANWYIADADAPLSRLDLHAFLTSPLLGPHVREDDFDAILLDKLHATLDADSTATPTLTLAPAVVTTLLERCHDRPVALSAWIEAVERVADTPIISTSALVKTTAILVAVRLRQLQRLRGDTIGAVVDLLAEIRVHEPTDPATALILRRLESARSAPLTPAHLANALDASAAPGSLRSAVSILRAADYDGRDSDLCVLVGLGSPCTAEELVADPFFAEDVAAKWGSLGPRARVAFRRSQLEAAARRATRCVTCAQTAKPASLAEVGQLAFRFEAISDAIETSRTRDLEVLAHAVDLTTESSFEGGRWSRHAALMAQAEWARTEGHSARVDELSAHVDAARGLWEYWRPALRPYLGDVATTDSARLSADAAMTVEELRALSRCPFRVLTRSLFHDGDRGGRHRLDHAVKTALGQASETARWRVVPDLLEGARADLRLELGDRLTLGASASDVLSDTSTQSRATAAAVERWRRHLGRYVNHRVESLAEDRVARRARTFADHTIGRTSVFRNAVARFHWPNQRTRQHAATWFRRAAAGGDNALSEESFRNLVADVRQTLLYASTEPGFLKQLDEVQGAYAELMAYGRKLYGPVASAHGSWAFGGEGREAVRIRLGETSVAVRGMVPRIWVVGMGRSRIVKVTEFDTGVPLRRWRLEEEIRAGLRPRVIVHALAVREALAKGGVFDASPTAPIELSYDFARGVDGGQVDLSFDQKSEGLRQVASSLGSLVTAARAGSFPLIPHPAACPHLSPSGSTDSCPMVDSCRLADARRWPDPDAEPSREAPPPP